MPAKARPKKTVLKKTKAGSKTTARKGDAFVCGICGYRLIVDRACGCATLHTYVCCGRKMGRTSRGKRS